MNTVKRLGLALVLIALLAMPAAAQSVCPDPQLGEACTFNAYEFSFVDPAPITVDATCRAVSDHLYVFVADDVWTAGQVNQNQVDTIVAAWEVAVPSDASQGMYAKILDLLLVPLPDVHDDDERIYLVIHAIKDTATFPVNAYFRELDQQDDHGDPLSGSNAHEILFLKSTNINSDERLSDLAAVFTDLLHYTRDPNEAPWVKDVIRRRMAIEMGYTNYKTVISEFGQQPGQSLLGIEQSGRTKLNHGPTTLFGIYLAEVYSSTLWSFWMGSNLTGREGYEHGMSLVNPDVSFCGDLHDFVMRNGLDRAPYAYESYEPPTFAKHFMTPKAGDIVSDSLTLQSYAGAYLEIDISMIQAGDEVEMVLDVPDSQGVQVSAVKYSTTPGGDLTSQAITLQSGAEQTTVLFDDLGADYDRMLLVISRCAAAEPMLISVSMEMPEAAIDGDSDAELDGDGDDAPLDGDLDAIDGDMDDELEPEADVDGDEPEPVITGDKTCPEINSCYSECENNVCRDACVEDGAAEAQQLWDDFLYCISGSFSGGTDCLALPVAADREQCMRQQCSTQYEACKIPEIDDGLPEEGGGGGCGQVDGFGLWFVLAALAGLLARGRRRA